MTNYGIVLIDDLRSFKTPVKAGIIRTAAESMKWLETLSPDDTIDQLWLDHDLGLDANGVKTTIIAFSDRLEHLAYLGEAPVIHEIVVHTSNGPGAGQVIAALKRYYNVKRVDAKDYLVVTGIANNER